MQKLHSYELPKPYMVWYGFLQTINKVRNVSSACIHYVILQYYETFAKFIP